MLYQNYTKKITIRFIISGSSVFKNNCSQEIDENALDNLADMNFLVKLRFLENRGSVVIAYFNTGSGS